MCNCRIPFAVKSDSPCAGCKRDKCEFCTDLEYQASMDQLKHTVESQRREGESFEECEWRLRRTTGGAS